MTEPHAVTPETLLTRIGLADAPAIVDICIDADFALDPHLVPGAFRHRHDDLSGLPERLAGRDAVIICQKGLKLSQGVAALLRETGVRTRYLKGGMIGWRALKDAPALPARHVMPALDQAAPVWITAHGAGVEDLACAWLIKRFVSPQARLLFVTRDAAAQVADRFGGTIFGRAAAPGTEGPAMKDDTLADFAATIKALGLRLPGLQRLAWHLRPDGRPQPAATPPAASLQAIHCGMTDQHRNDENALVRAFLPVFDALYLWARSDRCEVRS